MAKVRVRLRHAALLLSSFLVLVIASPAVPGTASAPRSDAPIASPPGGMFTENAGQLGNAQVRFYLVSGGFGVGFAESSILLNAVERAPFSDRSRLGPEDGGPSTGPAEAVRGVLVRITFIGSNRVTPEGRGELPHRSHFFLGNDPGRWRTNVRSYGEIVYPDLYDGVDFVVTSAPEGRLKYEYRLRAGADPSQIVAGYEGAGPLALDDGALVVATILGEFRDAIPRSYQGERNVACRFVLRGPASVGYACDGRDPRAGLVIDPLLYGTFLGGMFGDEPAAIVADAAGNAYVAGSTWSPDFPTTPGAYGRTHDASPYHEDVFVTKLDDQGKRLVYSTFVSGFQHDEARALAVDAAGSAYVTGQTGSPDFPTTPGAYDPTYNGPWCNTVLATCEAFLFKLSPDGARLEYSTFLGGATTYEVGEGIAVDLAGNAYVTGTTSSANASSTFPTTPDAFDPTFNGGTRDAFLAKFDPTGRTLLYSTFLGGSSDDYGHDVAVDADGNTYAVGSTRSSDFPTTPGAYDTALNLAYCGSYHCFDGYVVRLSPDGARLESSTFLGGEGRDIARSVALGPRGVHVAGDTNSDDFPTTPWGVQTAYRGGCDATAGCGDAFAARLDANGSALGYATYLGGTGADWSESVRVDAAGYAYVAGSTGSPDFPLTPGAFDTSCGSDGNCDFDGTRYLPDAFVAKLAPEGDALVDATFLGGSSWEGSYFFLSSHVALDGSGGVYITGSTASSDFPTTPGAFDTRGSTGTGYYDGFVVKIGLATPPNAPPTLSWTAEPRYVSDGLDPEAGTTFTAFAFRVAYADEDNDAPADVWLRLEKPLGVPWGTFRMARVGWLGAPGDYAAGAVYGHATTLPAGTDYAYSFNASDGEDWALGSPTLPIDAPDVVPDAPPVAVAQLSSATAVLGEVLTFDGTLSSDDVGITAYRWDFGDGTVSASATADHAYSDRGTFTVALTVWDTAGQEDTATLAVEVRNRPPVADAGPERTVRKGTLVTLDGGRSWDPDGDALAYAWTQVGGPPVSLAGADGVAPSFTPTVAGAYAFRLRVDDGYGGTSEDGVAVSGWGLPPVARLAAIPLEADVGEPFAFDGTDSYDPDGAISDFAFDFGDGTVVSGPSAVRAHPYAVPGLYTVALTVTDDDGNASAARVTIKVIAPSTPAGMNWKPAVAFVFAIVLAIAGAWSSRRAPWKGAGGRRAVLKTFAAVGLPFVLLEAATGVLSLAIGILAIPPALGVGSLVDSAILAAGLAVALARAGTKGRNGRAPGGRDRD